MIRRIGILFLGTLFVWAVLAYPVYKLATMKGLVNSFWAAALCFLPGSLTLLWSQWVLTQKPERRPAYILAGSGVRMGIVIGTAVMLAFLHPYFKEASFWVSLLVFYLFTLALEMILLLAGWPRTTS